MTRRSRFNLRVLVPHLRPHLPAGALTGVIVVGVVALDLVVPILLARFVDLALAGTPVDALLRIAGLYLVASVATQVLAAFATYLGTRVGWSVANDLRMRAVDHVVSLDMDHHNETNPGTLIERVDGDITAVATFFSHFAVKVASAVLLLVGIVAITFGQHVVAGWTVLGFMVVVGATLYGVRGFAVRAATAERGVSGRLAGFVEEHLGAIDDLRANAGGVTAMHRFRGVMGDYLRIGVQSWLRRSVIWTSSIGLFGAASLVALVSGSALALTGSISVGTVLLLYQYMNKLEGPIEEIANQTQEIQRAAAGLGRLTELLAVRPSIGRSGTAPLPSGALPVAIRGVDFAYEDAPVLSDITLDIPAGTTVGLLGRTGSGKSSLIKLLARVIDPGTGSVSIGDTDLRDVDPAALLARVATVPQDVHLFSGSIHDNITLFDPTIPRRVVDDTLRRIGLDGWVAQLPDGADTRVGHDGIGLSAGEAQLIAFARAHMRDPGLVILDEPSSKVDPATEAILSRAIEHLVAGRTAIIIAHRLATVRTVDRIVVLDAGRVVEQGDRETLADDPDSRFAAMLRAGQWGDGTVDSVFEETR